MYYRSILSMLSLCMVLISPNALAYDWGWGLKLGAMSGQERKDLNRVVFIQAGGDKILIPSLRVKIDEKEYVNLGFSYTGSIFDLGTSEIDFSTTWAEAQYEKFFKRYSIFGGLTYHFNTKIQISNQDVVPDFKFKNGAGVVIGAGYKFTEKFGVGVRARFVEYKRDGLPALNDRNGESIDNLDGSSYGVFLEYVSN